MATPVEATMGWGRHWPRLLQRLDCRGVTVEIDYQLSVDHAAMIAAHDAVVFADAAMGLESPYHFDAIASDPPQALGSHQVSPEAALALAGLLFGKSPPGWMLAIAGEAFGMVSEGLSHSAQRNLAFAVAFVRGWIAGEPDTLLSSGTISIALQAHSEAQMRRPSQ